MKVLEVVLTVDGQTYAPPIGKTTYYDAFYVECREEAGHTWSVFIHPKRDLVIQSCYLRFALGDSGRKAFLCNGYQSWSETRWTHEARNPVRNLRFLKGEFGAYGDALWGGARTPNRPYAWTLGLFQNTDGSYEMVGSLREDVCFTRFEWLPERNELIANKDLCDLRLSHSFPLAHFWRGSAARESDLFEAYAGQARREAPYPWRAATSEAPALGWTSWYRYFNRITYANLTRDLDIVAQSSLPFKYFQIDDGWQSEVGDWREARPAMQPGMADMARRIREAGLTPGIWLAPFVAGRRSALVRQHPDWLLRDGRGRPIRAGWNPMWGGDFYALDISRPAVREYLSGCLHIAAERWGYDFFKLDFLYAAALYPGSGRTRAQVMADALDFLYAQLPCKTILACGVPLGANWGRCEYVRTSGDTHLSWSHRLAAWIGHRERPDTLAALHTNLTRWGMGRGAWGQDPDVFILRAHSQRLTPPQQNTLLTVNALLGDLLFTSDDPASYSPEQEVELLEALELLQQARVSRVQPLGPELYRIDYGLGGKEYMALVNLSGRRVRLAEATLSPHETLTLLRR